MSGSSVIPEGSNFMLMNFETNASSGTPYCSPRETAMAKASITPERVEPCFETFRNISPMPSSGYSPAVTYPSEPPTENDVVRDGRDWGRRLRTGCASDGAGSAAFFLLSADSGWATLQLFR